MNNPTESSEIDTAQNGAARKLEVPYAYGKLSVSQIIDPETNLATGYYNIVDEDRGWSFGAVKFNADGVIENPEVFGQITTENFNAINITESEEQVKDVNVNTNENQASAEKRSLDQEVIVSTKTNKVKMSNMLKQKKENDYLVSQPKKKAKISSTDLGPSTSQAQTGSSDKLNVFKDYIGNLNLPLSNLSWGTLNFYSGSKLLYTYHLAGDDPILINKNTLKDVKVPIKLSGSTQFKTESLVEDFRQNLKDGFTLSYNKTCKTIDFQRATSTKNQNEYKIFMEPEKSIEITDNESKCIFDEKFIKGSLDKKVTSMESALDFTNYLNLAIVVHVQMLHVMGVGMSRINKNNLSAMPYYMILKFNSGYDNLNSHTTKMLNKYLTRNNSLLSSVLNIQPTTNLKIGKL